MVSSTTPSSGEYLLEMSGINKSFPGVKALDNVGNDSNLLIVFYV
ncbi:TPA: hypothetical protein ACIDIW_004440, partial [Shigella boydii]